MAQLRRAVYASPGSDGSIIIKSYYVVISRCAANLWFWAITYMSSGMWELDLGVRTAK